MRTRFNRLLVLSLFSVASLVWPASSSAQVLEACRVEADLDVAAGTHIAQGVVSYTCGSPKPLINVSGCLLLDGVPVDCDGDIQSDSSSASVNLSFPCVPGAWTLVAIGSGAERAYPAADVDGPEVVISCDPLRP